MKNIFYFLIAFLFFSPIAKAQNKYWSEIKNEQQIKYIGKREIIPQKYQTIQVDFTSLKQYLNTAPKGLASDAPTSSFVFDLPMPDGTSQRFKIVESPLLSADFAAARPDIKTFSGYGIDDKTATLVMDYTSQGFHAMVLSAVNGTIFIDPYSFGETSYYVVYYKKDYKLSQEKINQTKSCGYKETDKDHQHDKKDKKNDAPREKDGANGNISFRPSGSQLRTYRLVVAATGEYTQVRGGTVASAQNAIVTSINRVRGVYEKEVACSFTLVNNAAVVYTNGATDPYTNDDGGDMLEENGDVLGRSGGGGLIGFNNYDIGHVFSTGGGGVAYRGSLCTNTKYGGVTGLSNPIGDAFDIDFVAHEIGHQFGGNHTFNSSTSGNCTNGTRSGGSAYEPGSGSTIMAYAGICSPSNLQNNTDNNPAYFHTKNYDEILDVIEARNCIVPTGVVNNIPTINLNRISGLNIPPSGFKIPASTPFFLGADATDADAGDVLTYCWEQFDLGVASDPTPAGTLTTAFTGPIFRSFVPTTNPIRAFPRLVDLVNNTTRIGESLPATSRNMTFRVTVRDNKPISGVRYGAYLIEVVNTGQAFAVTAPNTSVNWQGCSTQTVTWNVAGTTANTINCANVKILLSTDGGFTYPTTLLASTPNDGSADITVPNINTSQARIRVEAVGNFFFDISNTNFTIQSVIPSQFTMSSASTNSVCRLNPIGKNHVITLSGVSGCNSPINLSITSPAVMPAGITAVLDQATISSNGIVNLNVKATAAATIGNSISFTIAATNSIGTITNSFTFTVADENGCNSAPTAINSNLMSYPQDIESYVIENEMMKGDDPEDALLPGYNLRFKLRSLTSSGTLKLNGVNMAVNQIFSRDDLLNNRIAYYPNNRNTELDDLFQFSAVDSQNAESNAATFSISLKDAKTPTETQVLLYPNPLLSSSDEKILINLEGAVSTTKLKIMMYDMKGSLIKDFDTIKLTQFGRYELDLKGLSTGVYALKIQTGKASFTKRFVKEN
ncbi:MAG: T9SS C-terminal target domain-containing protein [Cytophagales bacterium]|nr:MAG: T9SS C-terminal target domain-containing protein [Cytophagales bacterium]